MVPRPAPARFVPALTLFALLGVAPLAGCDGVQEGPVTPSADPVENPPEPVEMGPDDA